MKICFVGKLIGTYLFQLLNGWLLGAYLAGNFSVGILTSFQLVYLGVMVYLLAGKGHTNWKNRLIWLALGLCLLFLVQCLSTGSSSNQTALEQVMTQTPVLSFSLFLLNASLVEEYLYRYLLWRCFTNPWLALFVTSSFFTWAHSPESLSAFGLYLAMGLVLGLVRLKSDLYTACSLHVTWNGLVYLLAFL